MHGQTQEVGFAYKHNPFNLLEPSATLPNPIPGLLLLLQSAPSYSDRKPDFHGQSTSIPKNLHHGERAQDPLRRRRSDMHLKCSYQRHPVNILWSKGSPVFPPEQRWARARGFGGSW